MGVRERKVEEYLAAVVREHGALTRAWKKSNVPGVMDQIVFFPPRRPGEIGHQVFVEVKTVDGKRSGSQIREADRYRRLGALVTCVYGHEGVDHALFDMLMASNLKEEYR